MDQTPDQWSADQWKSTLRFVPTREARAAATQQKVDFLMEVIKGNPLVTAPFIQKALLGELSDVVFEINTTHIHWLSRELGDQFLTLCLKTVRQSVATFVLYSLHTIDIKVLLSISIKGKKARFRDWRDVIFTTVKELPVVKYKNKLQFQLPEGYQLVTSNHEMLMAAEKFGNCSFKLSDQLGIIEGNEFVLIIPEQNGVEPVMFHGTFRGHFELKLVEAKHPNNQEVSLDYLKEKVNLLSSLCLSSAPAGYAHPVDLPYTWEDHYEGGWVLARVVVEEAHGFMRAVDLPEVIYDYDPDADWVDSFDDEDEEIAMALADYEAGNFVVLEEYNANRI